MDASSELLQYTYQGARMGQTSIEHLKKHCRDKAFARHLDIQLAEYSGILHEAYEGLRFRWQDERDVPLMQRAASKLSVEFNARKDPTAQHMAEMMLQGSMMGVIESIKRIRQYEGRADAESLALARKLLATEEANIERLKAFL